MRGSQKGLTKTYNRLHTPDEQSAEIQSLRRLHADLDRAALDAYGWHDVEPVCDFYPEFDEDEDEEEGRTKKKKYRYRWSDEVRDEVLARLIALNAERAAVETGPTTFLSAPEPKKPRGRGKKITTANSNQLTLGASE